MASPPPSARGRRPACRRAGAHPRHRALGAVRRRRVVVRLEQRARRAGRRRPGRRTTCRSRRRSRTRSRRGRAPSAARPRALRTALAGWPRGVVRRGHRAHQRGAGPEEPHPGAVVAEQRDRAVGVEGADRGRPGRASLVAHRPARVRREGGRVDRPVGGVVAGGDDDGGAVAGRAARSGPCSRASNVGVLRLLVVVAERQRDHVDGLVALDAVERQQLAQREQLEAAQQVGLGHDAVVAEEPDVEDAARRGRPAGSGRR